MTITLRCRDRCVICGCRLWGMYVATVRVNKHSIRATGGGLGVVLPCPECGSTVGCPGVRGVHGWTEWALDRDSSARVAAYRERKGWAA